MLLVTLVPLQKRDILENFTLRAVLKGTEIPIYMFVETVIDKKLKVDVFFAGKQAHFLHFGEFWTLFGLKWDSKLSPNSTKLLDQYWFQQFRPLGSLEGLGELRQTQAKRVLAGQNLVVCLNFADVLVLDFGTKTEVSKKSNLHAFSK